MYSILRWVSYIADPSKELCLIPAVVVTGDFLRMCNTKIWKTVYPDESDCLGCYDRKPNKYPKQYFRLYPLYFL